jgi:hypothetical protein
MKLLMAPVLALGLLVGSYSNSDEPGEADMRAAFTATLAAQVQAALDFVAETGGEEAVRKVRDAGTDRFEIRAFRKLDCARDSILRGYICGFTVDIGVVDGALARTLSGYFLPGPGGLAFRHEA